MMKDLGENIMKKDIKDYLHLYLGCECRCYNTWDVDGWKDSVTAELLLKVDDEDSEIGGLHLILRPLSDMRKEERQELHLNLTQDISVSHNDRCKWDVIQFQWLLSKGFDLFGLIEAGLAIDSTKIPSL